MLPGIKLALLSYWEQSYNVIPVTGLAFICYLERAGLFAATWKGLAYMLLPAKGWPLCCYLERAGLYTATWKGLASMLLPGKAWPLCC
jgi:hypothetical protein